MASADFRRDGVPDAIGGAIPPDFYTARRVMVSVANGCHVTFVFDYSGCRATGAALWYSPVFNGISVVSDHYVRMLMGDDGTLFEIQWSGRAPLSGLDSHDIFDRVEYMERALNDAAHTLLPTPRILGPRLGRYWTMKLATRHDVLGWVASHLK